MRIGLLLDDTLDAPDGVQQYVMLLGQWLASQNHEVYYIVAETKRLDIKNVISTSNVVRLKFNGNNVRFALPILKYKAKKILNDLDLDVLHVQLPFNPLMAGKFISAASSKIAIVGTFHILPFSTIDKYNTKLAGFINRPLLKKFSSVASVSVPAKTFAHDYYGVNSDVISNAVNVKQYMTKSTHKNIPLRIMYLGRLVERKGCMKLLQSLCILRERNPKRKYKVIIAGSGPELHKLEKFTRNNNLDDIVEFLGFVEERRKIDLLRKADICVFPSISGESFGIVLIEAMAAGNAVVLAGNNPGYKSVMGKQLAQQTFNAQNPYALAELLKKYIEDPKLRKQTVIKQNSHVHQYDIDQVGRRVQKMYMDCLNINDHMS